MIAESMLKLLISSSKLDREKGSRQFEDLLKSNEDQARKLGAVKEIETNLEKLVSRPECSWEEKHGYLLAKKSLVAFKKIQKDSHFLSNTQVEAVKYLQDGEVRVRGVAGELLGELCKHHGVTIYRGNSAKVISLIRNNLERKLDEGNEGAVIEEEEVGKLMAKLANSSDSSQVFHDTAGWKNLETSMKCLQHMIEGCGKAFSTEFDENLFELLTTTLDHTNRFVRETGYYVCATLIAACQGAGEVVGGGEDAMEVDEVGVEALQEAPQSPVLRFGASLSQHLAAGLSDNWSQVRLASSTACRQFLLSLSEAERRQFYPVLLPRLCLNRYYLAEGVRIYSQKTWAEVVGKEGCRLVEEYLADVVQYYTHSTLADNHAVREAACQCIAELANKINLKALQPYVDLLLRTLISCFKDDSWPVRDMACVAAGSFVRCFPEESRSSLGVLMPLFWTNLGDPISSVRQGAAIALANTVRAYGNTVLTDVETKVKEGLADLVNQPVESEKYGNLDTGPAEFGVAKRIRDNDPVLHENQQMYSCGSLAPKMGRGGGGGCTDSKFRKPSEPWELADGCVHLVGELATIKDCEECVDSLLLAVSKCQQQKHFVNHLSLFQTICVRFGNMASVLNKKILKPRLEQFFDIIFYSLESENALASYSAEDCLRSLSTVLGPNILRGRIENYNPHYLTAYSKYGLDQPGGQGVRRVGPGGVGDHAYRQPPLGGSPGHTATNPMSIPTTSGGSYQPLGGTPT